ncbi:hypothetical protein HOY80DRAFT_1104307 [Tuber brumale]|nr:hypothetical protein HOY80DRAFT_1104307 [Tuber brumale]
MRMGSGASAYTGTTILVDYIMDVGKAEPTAVISPCRNQEQCSMIPSGPTESTDRKDYRRFLQHHELPGYLQRLMDGLLRRRLGGWKMELLLDLSLRNLSGELLKHLAWLRKSGHAAIIALVDPVFTLRLCHT